MSDLSQHSTPSVESLPSFMATLETNRQSMQEAEWREFTKRSVPLRKWRYFLAMDPYTRWGLVKPRGYPGDATLMDFAYRHPSVHEDITSSGLLGEAIFELTSGAKQSQSARQRIALIAAEIERKTDSESQIVVASFAAGHARELQSLPPLVASKISEFLALDSDPISLSEVEKSAASIPVRAVRRNVIKDDLTDLPNAELVYSLGLFDYLNEEFAALVLHKMWEKTKNGGVCIVANLAPTAANLGYCEAIMDWWMIPRTESDLNALADKISSRGSDVKAITIQQHGCFNYLRMERR
jgi:extracellular factor (EF) 3-hydroxypalmitic acid methyl ester biosynthesis protein